MRTNPDFLFNLSVFLGITVLELLLLIGIYHVLA